MQGANVNVASVNVGRRVSGAAPGEGVSEALCIMALDDDVPTNVMDVLRTGVPAIRQVSKIQIK